MLKKCKAQFFKSKQVENENNKSRKVNVLSNLREKLIISRIFMEKSAKVEQNNNIF